MGRILIIDDQPEPLALVASAIREQGHEIVTASTIPEGRKRMSEARFDAVVCELALGDKSGLDLLRELRAAGDRTPFILITGQATVDTAVAALREGAFDFLPKPINHDRLCSTLKKAVLSNPATAHEADAPSTPSSVRLLGASPAIVEVYNAVSRAAMTDSPVLIFGESGVGKEIVAREIHRHSPRASGPFIVFTCSALNDADVDRELFGIVGDQVKPAIFNAAQGGTLLLKQVHELPVKSQIKLARIIEKRTPDTWIGRNFALPDIRIIGSIRGEPALSRTMNANLFYSLSIIQIRVPPLRERLEDLPALVSDMLRRIAVRVRKQLTIGKAALKLLQQHPWHGNLRELANVLERAAVNCPGEELKAEDIEAQLRALTSFAGTLRPLGEVEREHILNVFARCDGNVSRASRLLQVDSQVLRAKLEVFGTPVRRPDASGFQCVACGTSYSEEEVRQLGGQCPRCVSVEGALLVPTGGKETPLPPDVPRFKDNRYVLYRLLARNPLSEVWAGWQPSLCRRVVIKFLNDPAQGLERFKREARIQATLRHPNIPAIYEAGTDELNSSRMFLAIEFIEGISLDQWNRSVAGKIPEPERLKRLLTVIRQVADALGYLHSRGLVHRDVKPQNIVMTPDNRAYLIDYGLARPFDITDCITAQGLVLGTLPFMSPEQIAGETERIGPPVDLWGLGATLYYLTTGRFPFYGSRFEEVATKIQTSSAVPPRVLNPSIGERLERVILRALAKRPEQRPHTAEEMIREIDHELRAG